MKRRGERRAGQRRDGSQSQDLPDAVRSLAGSLGPHRRHAAGAGHRRQPGQHHRGPEPEERRLRHGEIRDYLPNRHAGGRSFGLASDDTQQAFWTLDRLARDPAEAIRLAAASSRTTHGAVEAVDACRYLGALLVGALNAASREELLSELYTPIAGVWEQQPLAPAIDEIARGSFKRRDPPDIKGSGYVVKPLEAALWAFDRTRDFRSGCLSAVNLGDDADTTGAVYGQVAGAYYGVAGIPSEWIEKLALRDEIIAFADKLFERGAPAVTE
jgi:ADP-ribosylglycohydrolase